MRRHVYSPRLLWIAVALFTIGCGGSSTGPEQRLAAARAQWNVQGPDAYSMVVTKSCECLPGMTGPVRVTVRNGVVESRRYVDSGLDVPAELAAGFPSVEEMFAMIDDALREGITPHEIRYHPLGYPTRLAIGDPAADAPLYVVTDLQAL
jgi:hypothetical protein